MENDIKQKAEQLRKNAEAKNQQAQIKEHKYQQWLENQKKNNPNFRYYDENPLIIQSYEEFFVLTLFVSSFLFACILAGMLNELRWRIEFCDYGKLKRQCKILEDKLARPFFTQCTMKKSINVFFDFILSCKFDTKISFLYIYK